MPLVTLDSLFAQAARGRYGVGYFEAWDGYSLEAVMAAAEAERSPVIIGFGCMMVEQNWLDAGGLEALAALGRTRAAQMTVPVSFILNEARTLNQAQRAIEAGFNIIMLDTSSWPWEEAVRIQAELARRAHENGIAVEAELGHLPDALLAGGIDDSAASLTDPDEAARFVEQIGVDCLAVSIGNVHLLNDRYAEVDLERLEAIHRKAGVPLVIHGGTGFPPEAVPGAVAAGALKFNVGTTLKSAFLQGIQETLASAAPPLNVHALLGSRQSDDLLSAGARRMTERVRELMRLYGSSGRADQS